LAADREANFIGVLDIAGFEIFQNNSFEQLCINFTNEKLQEFFNNHMFKLEQEEYAKEQIVWVYIDFGIDSKQTIDLIEKKPNSIMAFLDEESIFPRATDETLIQKLHTLAAKNPKYGKVQFKKLNFQIQHYAGDVIYDVTDWITKNKDPLQDDIASAIQASTDGFISSLFTDPDLDPRERIAIMKANKAAGVTGGRSRGGGGASQGPTSASSSASKGGSGASFMTVAATYREQLDDLMTTLRSTEPNFIRCIIPNLKKETKNINAALVLEQLACNGVLEGIRISRKGFPNRITYPEFVKRYYLLHPTIRRNEAETKEATQTVMKHVADRLEDYFPKVAKEGEEARERPLYQFGVTKIFFRHGVLAWLEEQREAKLGQMVISIQAGARGWIARSAYKKIGLQTAAARTLQKNLKSWILFKEWGWWKLFRAAKEGGHLTRVDYDAIIKDLEKKVLDLESELEKINKDRDALRKDLKETNDGIASLESELDSANSRLKGLESDHSKLSDEKDSLQSKIDALESKVSSLSKEKAGLDSELREVDTKLKETRVRLDDVTSRRKGLEEDKKNNESKIASSTTNLENLEADQAKLKKQLAALEDENKATATDRDAASDKAAQLSRQVAQLQSQLEEVKDELDAGRKEKAKLESQKKDLESQLKSLQDDLESESSTLSSTKARQTQLTSEVESLNSKVDDATRKVADLTKSTKKLEQDLSDATADLEDAKANKSSAEKKGKTLQGQRDDLEARARQLEADNSRLDGAKREASAQLEDVNRDIDTLNGNVQKLQKSIQATEGDVARVQGDLDKAEAERENLNRQKKKLEQDLKDAEAELDAEGAKGSSLSKTKSKLDADIKACEDQLADLEAKKSSLQNENKKLKADLSDADAALEDAESKKADLERQLKNAQKELEDAKAQLDDEADERARADKAKKAAEQQLKDARADVDDLAASNRQLEDQIKRKTAEAAELAGKGDAAALAEAKSKWLEATKKLALELKEARDKLAEAEEANRGYDRELKNVEESLMSEKERAELLGKDAGKNAREGDAKLRALQDEADATRAKANQIKSDLTAAQKELEQLRSILSTEVGKRRR
jgi:myosin heavy subunit